MRSNNYPTNNPNPNKNILSTIMIFAVVETILLTTIIGAFLMGYIGMNFMIIGIIAASLVFMMGVVPTILKNKRGG